MDDSINFGIYNTSSSSPTMSYVTAQASGGQRNYGVCSESSSSPTISYLYAKSSGGSSSNYGVYQNGGIVDLKNSETQGSTSVNILSVETNSIILRTRFDGTININDEDVECKGVCDGDTCYADTCP